MPNHVKNRLHIIGSEKDVAKVLSEIKGEKDHIDFNVIVPMPKELVGTVSPMRLISKKDYDKQEERIAKGELTEFEKQLGLSRSLTKELSEEYIKKFGADNWYDWHIVNWGTKWNAYDQTITEDNVIEFNTAWSTPFRIFQALSQKYPTVKFRVEHADEDFGYNVGICLYDNGDFFEENIPDGGSLEAMLLAMKILENEEFYLNVFLTEDYLSDSEELSEFEDKLVDIAHKQGKLNENYPPVVLNKLKELALADEQYERIIEIDKLLKNWEVAE